MCIVNSGAGTGFVSRAVSAQQLQATLGNGVVAAMVMTDAGPTGSSYAPEVPDTEEEESTLGSAWLGTTEGLLPEPTEREEGSLGIWPGSGGESAIAVYEKRISAALNYQPTVTPGGDPIPATAFGNTYVDRAQYRYSNATIGEPGVVSPYYVNAELNQQIYWDVRRSSGPQKQVDISGPGDASIRDNNYRRVAKDLTPNVRWRPPRTEFWAENLTTRHEEFHVEQLKRFTREGIAKAVAWMNTKRVASEAAIHALLGQAVTKINNYVNRKAQRTMKNENEAYRNGAPAYRARARDIRARGKGGGYPP